MFFFLILVLTPFPVFGDQLFPDPCSIGGGLSTGQEVWVEGMSEPQPYNFAPGSYPVLFKFTPDHDSSNLTSLYVSAIPLDQFDPILVIFNLPLVKVLGPYKAGMPSNATFNFNVPVEALNLVGTFYGKVSDPIGDVIMCVTGKVVVD